MAGFMEGEWGAGVNSALGQASPLLLALGQNMQLAPNQRDPRATQGALALMMQQGEREKKRKAYQDLLSGGQPQQMPGQTPGFNPNAGGGLAEQMGLDPRVLAQLDPEQGMGLLAQVMAQRARPAETTEFDRLTQGLSPEDAARARAIKLGFEPDADTALRVGAAQQGRDPIAALRARASEAGIQPGSPEYAQFMMAGGAQAGLAVDVDPATGQVSVRQGVGAAQKPFTEAQSKDNVYTTRALGALATLEPIADALTSLGDRAADYDPTGLVRGAVQGDKYQVAKNAGDEFLQALLRKDTGAAITSQEQQLYGQTYLPQPGDNPAVLQQKAQARRRAVEALKAGVSPSQMVAIEKGLAASNSPALGAAPQSPLSDLSDDDLKALLETQ